MTKSIFVRCATGVGIAGALTLLAAAPIAAAPALSNTAKVKSAAPNTAIEARWRRRAWRRSYFIGSSYGRWRYGNSGCHIAGGYYRPNGCW
jgi:hypothetical protein